MLQEQLLNLFEKLFVIFLPTVFKGHQFSGPLLLASLIKLNLFSNFQCKETSLKICPFGLRAHVFLFFFPPV